jgi:hypothetical protein
MVHVSLLWYFFHVARYCSGFRESKQSERVTEDLENPEMAGRSKQEQDAFIAARAHKAQEAKSYVYCTL